MQPLKNIEMTVPEIFLDYQGPIDFPIIDSLLSKLKDSREFNNLHTTTRKRAYSLIVECLENICKHSALKKSVDEKLQPHILVKNENAIITITAGNPISSEKRETITTKLENVNSMSVEELKKLHEERINKKPVEGENGAGLGFICIAFKSGYKLLYNFNPLVSGYLYFEMQISLNK
jgi:Family of unknown function (DUF6272)